jgi:Tol biopolymer transport system component
MHLSTGTSLPIACALGLLLLTPGCTREPVKGKIVFTSNRDGNREIYTMNDDGRSPIRITDDPGSDDSPSWSPDGSTILFASDRDGAWNIYTIRADGTQLLQLTTGTGSNYAPSWCMDGTKILFSSGRDTPYGDLYIMDPNGGNVGRMTMTEQVKENSAMTNDGETIYMTVNVKDARSVAQYSTANKEVRILTPVLSQSFYVKLSRDERELLYVSNQKGSYQVYSLATSSRKSEQLTDDHTDILTPCWGSSNDEIYYSKRGALYRWNIPTRTETIISNSGDATPDWHER